LKFKNILIRILKLTLISVTLLFLLIFGYFEYEEIPIYNIKVATKFILGKTSYKPYEGLAEKLGFSKDDKLLIIHADDIGLSNSVNKASFKALKNGYVSSGSIMMPCDYISDVGQFAIENPSIDLGLHLTVTSEWRDYKWNGVLQPNKTPSLINKKGELFKNKKKFVLNADPLELKSELQAQVDLSKSIGIKPTHIDSHEGAPS
jgi:chitin disaccharide deacetylase